MTGRNGPAPAARGPARNIAHGDGDSNTITVPRRTGCQRCAANEAVLAKLRQLRERYGYFTRAELAAVGVWPRPLRFEDIPQEEW